jgi:hypothetical protein
LEEFSLAGYSNCDLVGMIVLILGCIAIISDENEKIAKRLAQIPLLISRRRTCGHSRFNLKLVPVTLTG